MQTFVCSALIVQFYYFENPIMNTKQWYETLFENYAKKYDAEIFTQGTLGECDFIEQELKNDK
jgi:hypothetical protein